MSRTRTYSVVDVADNSTTVFDGPCIVHGVYVITGLSAHAVPILDGTTQVAALAANSAAGAYVPLFGVTFETSLVVDPNDAATGDITVVYEPLDKS